MGTLPPPRHATVNTPMQRLTDGWTVCDRHKGEGVRGNSAETVHAADRDGTINARHRVFCMYETHIFTAHTVPSNGDDGSAVLSTYYYYITL